MRNILYLLILAVSANLSAQNDTLYFNTDWKKTTKAEAAFFRPIPLKKVGNLHEIKNYYSNGNLQMEGYYSSIENQAFHGEAKWYYENGELKEIRHYNKRMLEGEAVYYSKKGYLRAKGIYKDNEYWSGKFLDECCYNGYIPEYKDGKRIEKKSNITQQQLLEFLIDK